MASLYKDSFWWYSDRPKDSEFNKNDELKLVKKTKGKKNDSKNDGNNKRKK